MRISLDKVAKDITYDKVISQFKSLDKELLVNATKDKWKVFLEKINKRNLEGRQLSLFEITTNQNSLSLALANKALELT